MNHRVLIGFVTLGSALLPSCYVFEERRNRAQMERPGVPQETVTSQNQQQVQAQRDRMRDRDQKKTDTSTSSNTSSSRKTEESTPRETTSKPATDKKRDYKYAVPVPGKEGFVFSPFNNKMIDVRDMPSGQLVRDPTYHEAEEKFFRVP